VLLADCNWTEGKSDSKSVFCNPKMMKVRYISSFTVRARIQDDKNIYDDKR